MLIQKQYNKLIIFDNVATIFFIIEKAKETILDFPQGTVKVLRIYFTLIYRIYQYKMTQYNILNVKLPNSQLNKLKLGIKTGTEIT